MKKLTCEMCGSTDIVKQDGMYICQSCETKYSIEEAKKMMVEGTVDVTGSTVKVDSSQELENLYQIARRAKDDNNSENAAKYYDMILVKDPTSWEASFYVVYFKAMSCKIAEIQSAAISIRNCLGSVLNLIHDYVPADEQLEAVTDVSLHAINASVALYNAAYSSYYSISSDIREKYTYEWLDRSFESVKILAELGDDIYSVFDKNIEAFTNLAVTAWATAVKQCESNNLHNYFHIISSAKNLIAQCNINIGKCEHTEGSSTKEVLEKCFSYLKEDKPGIAYGLFLKILDTEDIKPIAELGLAVSGATSMMQATSKMFGNYTLSESYLSFIKGNNIIEHLHNSETYFENFPKKNEYEEYIKKLVHFNIINGEGLEILHYAAYYLDAKATSFLLGLGANINCKFRGETPLWYIASEDHTEGKLKEAIEAAKVLLDNGAEIDITADNGKSLYNENTDEAIKKLILEKNPKAHKGSAKTKACYVATAVYGSYDCPQVWTLRRYRDYTLAETRRGRAFIKTYYAISPTLVKWFGHTKWFKKMWKGKLDRMVKRLQAEGVESTPYEDRNW